MAFTGKTKDFIPPLSMFDMKTGVPLAEYATKPEQLRTNIGWVRAANRAIVQPTVAVPLKLRRIKKVGAKIEYEEIAEHEILDLIDQPHLAYNGKKLRQLNHTYLNLVGDTYMLMVKDGEPFEMTKGTLPDALQLLPAHLVEFTLGKEKYSESVVKYGQHKYNVATVIRDHNPDPDNPYLGQSIVSGAAAAIDSDQQMQSWNRRTFANNARPGLVFNLTGENISADVYDRLKQQMDELYTGDGAFRSLVVENGEVKPYMLTHQDLDFLASREFTRDEILAIFNTAPAMLGMSKDFNRANIEGARYNHLLINVLPRLEDEVAMWNAQLVKPYDSTLELYFENPLPQDIEAKLKEMEAGVNKWMTPDEVREEYGLEPLPNKLGAEIVVPINSIPLSSVVTSDKPKPAKEGEKSLPKPSR